MSKDYTYIEDEIVESWISFLKYANSLGFDFYIGNEILRYRGIFDDETYRFIAHNEETGKREYLYYGTIRSHVTEGDLTRSLMLHILPSEYTVEKWRGKQIHAYQSLRDTRIYPKNKTKRVISEFRHLMI